MISNKYFEIEDFSKKNIYELVIKEDMNDGDYMYKFVTYTKEEFESDELFQLVLCYLNTPYKYPKTEFGRHYADNKKLSWLNKYLDDKDLITYDMFGPSHTIADVNILYYDTESIAHPVKLKSFKDLLKDNKDLYTYMTKLFYKENGL